LSYDEEKQKFFININRDTIEAKFKHSSSDFYELDQVENLKVPFQIKSGFVYYTKVSIWQWQSVIESAKNLGLNTIEIEVPWNAHEPTHEAYDFDYISADLRTFIRLVYLNDMFLLVKIDPFVHCSLVDFGGLPSYLLADDSFDILNFENNRFKEAFKKYLDKLLPVLADFQAFNKGPIIGLVLQNYQYSTKKSNALTAFYTQNYVKFIRNQFEDNSITEMMLISEKSCITLGERNICDENINLYKPLERKLDQGYNSVEFKKSNCFCK
jgi:beta-galactosidase GanA